MRSLNIRNPTTHTYTMNTDSIPTVEPMPTGNPTARQQAERTVAIAGRMLALSIIAAVVSFGLILYSPTRSWWSDAILFVTLISTVTLTSMVNTSMAFLDGRSTPGHK